MPLVATEALASDSPGLPQSNGVADTGNEDGNKGGLKRPTLDLFWKLGQAKNEKLKRDLKKEQAELGKMLMTNRQKKVF